MSRGGKRVGAGRKPGIVTEAKRAIAEMAKEHADSALRVLVAVAHDEGAPPAARVSAANAILDRAYGKPSSAADSDASDYAPHVAVMYVTSGKSKPYVPSPEDYET